MEKTREQIKNDLHNLIGIAPLSELIGSKKAITDRLLELQGGYADTRRLLKQERLHLKTLLKKVNKRITELSNPRS